MAFSVEGELKELKYMFVEILKRLYLGNTPSGSKFNSRAIQGLKRKR